ncbi:MAG: hypothetical protein GY847_33140 [Proteobacteria bacterium]|nr:hypothetical protein [Pseudomonadota bacterium]
MGSKGGLWANLFYLFVLLEKQLKGELIQKAMDRPFKGIPRSFKDTPRYFKETIIVISEN